VKLSNKNCPIDVYFEIKTIVTHAARFWTQRHIYSKYCIQLTYSSLYAALLGAVAYTSKCFKFCCWFWLFSELTWNRSIRSKTTWAKSFLMLQLTASKSSKLTAQQWEQQLLPKGELFRTFSFGHQTIHAKVANSGAGSCEVAIARYHNRYFFKKRVALPPIATGKLAYHCSSLLPASGDGKRPDIRTCLHYHWR